MKTSPLFAPSAGDIARLVAVYPFAQLFSWSECGAWCTPLPLLLEEGEGDGGVLVGHLARGNPHVAQLRRQPRALAVFLGAHGYVSPGWMRDRNQAPTWNHETLQCDVEVAFDDAPDTALDKLVAHMERGATRPWRAEELGARRPHLAAAVVGFRARIVAMHGKFKLGQNERGDVREDILAALDAGLGAGAPLAAAMRRANREVA